MHVTNTITEYGIISKVLHWLSAIILFIQIPLGFYLVDLDFGEQRITIEDIHVTLGLTVFYIIIIRLINNILNPTPKLDPSILVNNTCELCTAERQGHGKPFENRLVEFLIGPDIESSSGQPTTQTMEKHEERSGHTDNHDFENKFYPKPVLQSN